MALAPLRHDPLVLLGDEEAALPLGVLRTVFRRVQTRQRGEVERLLERVHILKVYLAARPA